MRARTEPTKPLHLIARDYTLIASLADFRMLSTTQLWRLHFPSISRTRKRLFQLWQHGYVQRMTRPVQLGEGSSEFVYALAPKGAGLLARDHSAILPRMRLPHDISEHSQRINDFRIALQLAAQRARGISTTWQQGRELKMIPGMSERSSLSLTPIIPDAFFTIRSENRDFSYFLEIDRGTTDLKRVTLKVRGYLHLWADKTPHEKFEIRSFRVLFVTTSTKRLSHMLESLKAMRSHHARFDLLMFATFSDYSIAEPQKLFRPIWQSLGTEDNVNTTRLLPVPIPLPLPTTPGKPPV